AQTLPEATSISRVIWDAAAPLLDDGLAARSLPLRLLGVGLSGIEPLRARQKTLFADEERERDTRLDSVRDQIQERFGMSALKRGSGLLHQAEHQAQPRKPEFRPDSE